MIVAAALLFDSTTRGHSRCDSVLSESLLVSTVQPLSLFRLSNRDDCGVADAQQAATPGVPRRLLEERFAERHLARRVGALSRASTLR